MTKSRSVLSWSLCALLAACSDSNSPPPEASLVLPTAAVALAAIKPDSVVQTFQITSASPVAWTASTNVPWLTIRPASGTTPVTVTVVAKSDALGSGTNAAVISVRTPEKQNQPYTVPVTFQVSPPRTLAVSPTSLAFSAARGQTAPAAQPAVINITDGATTQWTATSDASWLTVTPASGTGPGSISIRPNTAGLAAGNYTGRITVSAPATGNTPQLVTVNLQVSELRAITASALPENLGSVTGAGTYQNGQIATLVATPAASAEFVNWTENGSVVAGAATYAFVVDRDRALVANFRPRTITISLIANPFDGGTTTGGGRVPEGANVTVVASPSPGFAFVNWTEGDSIVATTPDYSFPATTSRLLIANFAADPLATVIISASASPAAGGTVSGAGTYRPGTQVTLTATAAAGFAFTNWTENGIVVATTPSVTFTAGTNRTFVANFGTPSANVTITASANPPAGGTATGGGTFPRNGATVSLIATPNFGYEFVNWTEGTAVVSLSRNYQFFATADRALVANFSAGPGVNILGLTQLPSDELTVRARVTTSDFTLTSVQLTVSGRTVTMVQAAGDEWNGTVSLVGLPAGELDAVVTATDNRGVSSSATQRFTHGTASASQKKRRP